eukprot:scaffold9753_cov160-Amphora_coffeaeformis.AAC.2
MRTKTAAVKKEAKDDGRTDSDISLRPVGGDRSCSFVASNYLTWTAAIAFMRTDCEEEAR